jgi:hypothetical protein
MANGSIGGYNDNLREGSGRPPGPPLQPPTGEGEDDMEPRVRVLETHVDYIREGIAKLESAAEAARSDISWLKVEAAKIAVMIEHLPGKGLVVTAAVGTVTLTVTMLTTLSRFGFLVPIK